MDHSENDKRFYVYVHKDQEGKIRYVGSGSGDRLNNKTQRSEEHIKLWNTLSKVVVIDNISKDESLDKEQELLNSLDISELINKHKTVSRSKDLEYSFLSEFMRYDETSPSRLRWNKTFKSWRSRVWHIKDAPVACSTSKGYLRFILKRRSILAHRAVWVLYNKEDLSRNLVVDHIDSNKTNNIGNNLNAVTYQENVIKATRPINATTGVVGVKRSDRGYTAFWTEGDRTTSKTFSFCRFGYSEDGKNYAFGLACEYRALKAARILSEIQSIRLDEIDRILNEDKLSMANKSGATGIAFQGGSWVSKITINKVVFGKSFNPKKLFPDLPFDEAKQKAFELAVEYRKQKELELY